MLEISDWYPDRPSFAPQHPGPKLCTLPTISETQYCAPSLFPVVTTFHMLISTFDQVIWKNWVTAHDSRGFNGLLQCIELVELVCTSRWHIWVILSSDPQFDDTFDHGEYPSRFYTHDICIHRSEKRISPLDFLICTSPLTRPRARGITLKMMLS